MRNLREYDRRKPVVYQDPFSVFDSFFRSFTDVADREVLTNRVPVRPAANIVENEEGRFCIELAAPGFDKDDFNIELNGRELTVTAKKETETESDENQKAYHREFSSYEIERSFTLSEELDEETLNAKYENGILNIYVDRKPELTKDTIKKIDIQ